MVEEASIANPNLLAETQSLGEGQCLGTGFKTVLETDTSPNDIQGCSVSLRMHGCYSQEEFS